MKTQDVLGILVVAGLLAACGVRTPEDESPIDEQAASAERAPAPEAKATEASEEGTTTMTTPRGLEVLRTVELPFVPHDIAISGNGDLYAVELTAPMVHRLSPEGEILASWGGAGTEGGQFAFDPPPGAPPLQGGFLAVGDNGVVYVTDAYNNRVQTFDSEGNLLDVWESAVFNNPGPISLDANGSIYVVDFGGAHQFDADGAYLQTVQAGGEIDFDSSGNMFTVVAFENIALQVPAGGGEPLVWGGPGMEDGLFQTPMWLVVGRDDTVYIGDHSGRVQLFDAEGTFIETWSGEPESPLTGPAALAMDAQGNLYVATKDHSTVYVLVPQS